MKANFHVITGGPGAGKTTLVDALRRHGVATVAESGRRILRQQARIGGRATHWGVQAAYAELMLSWAMRDYEDAMAEVGPVVFDRGVPDLLGYCSLVGMTTGAHFLEAARLYRYAPRVFVAPPWEAIYRSDTERVQDFAEAVATHWHMVRAYEDAGYELVEVPCGPVEDRTRFILDAIGAG